MGVFAARFCLLVLCTRNGTLLRKILGKLGSTLCSDLLLALTNEGKRRGLSLRGERYWGISEAALGIDDSLDIELWESLDDLGLPLLGELGHIRGWCDGTIRLVIRDTLFERKRISGLRSGRGSITIVGAFIVRREDGILV